MSKTIINLRDIFTKGKFGEVQLGNTINEVIEILGEPVGISNNEADPNDKYNVKFLTYDSYEFWFIKYFDSSKTYKLSAFQNDSYSYKNTFEGYFEKEVIIDTWIFKHGITLKEMEKALQIEQLQYERYKKVETIYLEFENKSKMLFEYSEHLNLLICVGWMFHPELHFN